ncbi:hypothetical protein GCM10022243_57030 [Saccharothrix violaceirubra]|uniref:Secreted protein n=1 Tax=Saccharothrix violaceirubra TaxID=413306 RepID=A0A7W7T3G0_9PSEU|nr:hypothetical protein [Saccharothrix violaceirubra]MBB4965864.1 hypothetical protein [Saccharothrix violaceirubra]
MLVGTGQRDAVRRVTGLARSTPGRLTLVALLLIAVSLTAGALSVRSVERRSADLETLAERSEPLAYAAQEVYRAMADADATAASAFLSGGVESPALRARYQDDIAKAAVALSFATTETVRSPDLSAALTTLAGQLPVYTGLVETARTHNRQGNPVGAAYLREASALMRDRLLPAAEAVYRAESASVVHGLRSAGLFPYVELVLGLAALLVLVFAQRFLTRRTNRVFNVGLVAATLATTVSLLWVVTASVVVMIRVTDAEDHGAYRVDTLAQARIAMLTARGDEMLTLVSRGSGAGYEKRFTQYDTRLEGLLDNSDSWPTVRPELLDQHERWRTAHKAVRDADDRGEYTQAVAVALSDGPDGAARAFDALDASLVEGLHRTRTAENDMIASARGALTGAAPVAALMAVLAAVMSAAGLWQRLKEYR